MKDKKLQIKLIYVPGLRDIVFNEISTKHSFTIIDKDKDTFYIEYIDNFEILKELKSVSRVYLVTRDEKFNPVYLSKHKSILGDLIQMVIDKNEKGSFKTFKISCAGSESSEIKEIKKYVKEHFVLEEKVDADVKIHIAKANDIWEVGLQTTPRPLSLREYKVEHMSGAMDPTVAYSLNYLCNLDTYNTYLNIFSGSATLMIEAGLSNSNLESIVGFDNEKKRLSLSIQNIKKSGLIKKIKVHEFDIFEEPELGKFDVIVSDLPFGMIISKKEELDTLYRTFINYCSEHINPGGKLGIYTSQFNILERVIKDSNFILEKEVAISLITSEGQYLPVKIMVFGLLK